MLVIVVRAGEAGVRDADDQFNLTFEEDEQIAEAAAQPACQTLEADDKPARLHSKGASQGSGSFPLGRIG